MASEVARGNQWFTGRCRGGPRWWHSLSYLFLLPFFALAGFVGVAALDNWSLPQGGIRHFMEHLAGPVATWWKDLGSFSEWPEGSKQTIVDGVLKEANGRSIDELAETRDELLLELVKLRMLQTQAVTKSGRRNEMGD